MNTVLPAGLEAPLQGLQGQLAKLYCASVDWVGAAGEGEAGAAE